MQIECDDGFECPCFYAGQFAVEQIAERKVSKETYLALAEIDPAAFAGEFTRYLESNLENDYRYLLADGPITAEGARGFLNALRTCAPYDAVADSGFIDAV